MKYKWESRVNTVTQNGLLNHAGGLLQFDVKLIPCKLSHLTHNVSNETFFMGLASHQAVGVHHEHAKQSILTLLTEYSAPVHRSFICHVHMPILSPTYRSSSTDVTGIGQVIWTGKLPLHQARLSGMPIMAEDWHPNGHPWNQWPTS